MSRRENYIKVVQPKITERGIIAKHWPKNWDEEITFANFETLRTIAALTVDAIWPPIAKEIATALGVAEQIVIDRVQRLQEQGMIHPGDNARGFVLTPNGIRIVRDVTFYERYRPDAPRVPIS